MKSKYNYLWGLLSLTFVDEELLWLSTLTAGVGNLTRLCDRSPDTAERATWINNSLGEGPLPQGFSPLLSNANWRCAWYSRLASDWFQLASATKLSVSANSASRSCEG